MDIACARCQAPIAAADIDLSHGLAKCRACNAVFDFSAQIRRGGDEYAASPLARRRAKVPLPEGLSLVDDSIAAAPPDYRLAPASTGRLLITRTWFTPQSFAMLLFCIAWDSFLVFWYSTALFDRGVENWIFIVFPIGHVAVGIYLTYATIARFVNKTWITVTPESLSVRHGPLPWPGNRSLPASALEQLYCEEIVYTGRRGAKRIYYALSAVLKDGRKAQLLSSLPKAEQALFLEQRIEERLGIEDQPVGGEYRA